MTPVVDDTFRAAIITDIDHCPSREAASESNLNAFLDFSAQKNPDYVISLGDNASHRLRNCSETGDMDARYIANFLRKSGKPTHFVLGDHDIASSVESYEAWMQTIEREKTYYSFDTKDVHTVVIDTVLGGEPMRSSCEDDARCAALLVRMSDLRSQTFPEYWLRYPDVKISKAEEMEKLKVRIKEERHEISLTHSDKSRDAGRVSEEQLEWLRSDLERTKLSKVVIFSDHPLFPFVSSRKVYDIVNVDKVREILEGSKKEVVAISGEAHLWHEEERNGIRYYIVDEFRKANGSWAYFTWNNDGFSLEKVVH